MSKLYYTHDPRQTSLISYDCIRITHKSNTLIYEYLSPSQMSIFVKNTLLNKSDL